MERQTVRKLWRATLCICVAGLMGVAMAANVYTSSVPQYGWEVSPHDIGESERRED